MRLEWKLTIAIASVFAALLAASNSASAGYVTVDLSPYANARIQNYQPSSAGYPEGPVTLGGVPFDIQKVGGNNAWNAEYVTGAYPRAAPPTKVGAAPAVFHKKGVVPAATSDVS